MQASILDFGGTATALIGVPIAAVPPAGFAGIPARIPGEPREDARPITAAFPWTDVARATPLADLSRVCVLRRHSEGVFDRTAIAMMSRATFTAMRRNENPADLYGRRTIAAGDLSRLTDAIRFLDDVFTNDDLPAPVYLGDVCPGHDALMDGIVVVVPSRLKVGANAGGVTPEVRRELESILNGAHPNGGQGLVWAKEAYYHLEYATALQVG